MFFVCQTEHKAAYPYQWVDVWPRAYSCDADHWFKKYIWTPIEILDSLKWGATVDEDGVESFDCMTFWNEEACPIQVDCDRARYLDILSASYS